MWVGPFEEEIIKSYKILQHKPWSLQVVGVLGVFGVHLSNWGSGGFGVMDFEMESNTMIWSNARLKIIL
jgi:hypothetical protein